MTLIEGPGGVRVFTVEGIEPRQEVSDGAALVALLDESLECLGDVVP